jgi:hypothetical protein
MWLVNFVQGKNCLLEKTCWVTVGGRNLPGGSSETAPTCINPSDGFSGVEVKLALGKKGLA